MNYLIEFATSEPLGFSVFLVSTISLIAAIVMLIAISNGCFDGEVKSSKIWPRTDCNCDVCHMNREIGKRNLKRFAESNKPDLDIKAPNLTHPKTEVMSCGHYNIGCTENSCNDG